MKFRHIHQIVDKLKLNINVHEDISLRRLLSVGAVDHIEEIEEVLTKSRIEYDFENIFNDVSGLWKDKRTYSSIGKSYIISSPLKLEFDVFNKTHICINTHKQYSALDQQLITVCSLILHPESSNLQENLLKFIRLLTESYNILNDWMNIQKQYITLNSLFSSNITNEHFKSLLIRYERFDILYDTIITTAINSPHLLVLTSESGFPKSIFNF